MKKLPFQVKIDFNEQIIRSQQIKYLKRWWIKRLPEYIQYLLLLIGCIYMLEDFRGRFYTILDYFNFIKSYIILYVLILLSFYIYQRLHLNVQLKKLIEDAQMQHENQTIIEFAEEYLRLKTSDYDLKYNWNLITYHLQKNSIIIRINMNSPFDYLLNREETLHYDAVVDIIKSKSKLKYKLSKR